MLIGQDSETKVENECEVVAEEDQITDQEGVLYDDVEEDMNEPSFGLTENMLLGQANGSFCDEDQLMNDQTCETAVNQQPTNNLLDWVTTVVMPSSGRPSFQQPHPSTSASQPRIKNEVLNDSYSTSQAQQKAKLKEVKKEMFEVRVFYIQNFH